jgi:TrpR-related protein YerC/YecD
MRGPQDTQNTSKQKKRGSIDREALYDALLKLRTKDECARFLRDLCTVAEIDALSERLAIARMVSNDETYRNVADKTGASSATVTRVAHWLNHGTGGYRTVISRMKR